MSKILHKLPTSVLVSIAIATVLGSTIVQPLLFNSPLPIFSLIPNWILWMVFLLALLVTIYQAYLTLEANQAKFDLLPDDDLTNDFVGRKEQVDELTQLLLDLTTHPAIVICGMGGMGKTTLAEKVLHNNKKLFDYRVNFSFGKQMFEPVTGMMKDVENEASTTDAVLVKIARALGLPGITEKSIRTNEKKLILKEQLRGKRIIVFFDNIESEEMTNHVINDICSILSPASKLLITSRVVLKGERIRHLSLIGLSESESIALLKKNGNHIPSIHKAPRNELRNEN